MGASMTEVILGIIAATLLVTVVVALAITQGNKRRVARAQHNRWITDALKSIASEADRKRLHIHAAQKVDVKDTFLHLRQLVDGYPGDVHSKIDQMEDLWQQLDSQVTQFNEAPASSTLQSSVVAVRTSKLANEIGRIATSVETSLAG